MPPSLIVVDDDPQVLRAICATLDCLGTVIPATDGRSALERIEAGGIDVLVADLRLPDTSGIELIAKARAMYPTLPGILLTGDAELDDLVEAINRAEVYRFLAKPIQLDDLQRTVESALEAVELRRERERLHAELEERHAAVNALYEATRELAQASGRSAIVTATLSHLTRTLAFDAAAVLLAHPVARRGTIYLQAQSPLDEKTLVSFKERTIAKFNARSKESLSEHDVRVVLLGAQVAPATHHRPSSLELVEAPIETGDYLLGLVHLLRVGPAYREDAHRLLGVMASQTAQAVRRDEEQLRSQRRQLDLLVRSMADGVVMIGEDNEITVVNAAARRMLGLGPETVVNADGIREKLMFDPFDTVRGMQPSRHTAVREEVECGGRTLHAIVTPVLDSLRTPAGVAVVLRDLTAERELERRKEEFVSVVSHELRTPLASISGSLDLVLRGYVGNVEEKQRHYLEMARDSCSRLNVIVDDLLDLSKYESGRLEVEFDEVDLSAVMDDVVASFQAAAISKKIEMLFDGPEEALVSGDAARLSQVVNNLLSNALKFTPANGQVEARILEPDLLTDTVVFTVWNSGSAIEEEDLERIFDKFSQLPATKRKPGGTGLGLAISRGLIETHGGRLWAERCDDGVLFVAAVPRLQGIPGPPQLDGRRQIAARTNRSVAGLAPVLIAERTLANAYAIKGLLLRLGLSAIVARSEEEALALARQRSLSLLVVDPRLGPSLEEALASDSEIAALPKLLTAGSHLGEAGEAIAVDRPVESTDLIATILHALQGQLGGRRFHAMVIDPDPMNRKALAAVLAPEGYDVQTFGDPDEALSATRGYPIDLVVLDALLDLRGDVAVRVRTGIKPPPALIVLVDDEPSESASTQIEYLRKPVEPARLAARAATFNRSGETQQEDIAPTELPGSHAIERELRRRIAAKRPFACLHITVDELKDYIEAFGYAKAEGVVQQVGALLREVLRTSGDKDDFIGHVQRDHYVAVTEPDRADSIGINLLTSLQRVLPLFYGREDRTHGYLSVPGRYAPLMSGCVVAMIDPGGRFLEPTEIFAAARTTRERAKGPGQSIYLRDEAGGVTGKTVTMD